METKVQEKFSATDLLNLLPDAFTSLTRDEQELSLAIYRNLALGNSVSVEDLVITTSLDEDAIREILDKWPGIFYDENRNIVGYWGLAIKEMGHKIELIDNTLYGWCAWDTLFIPQLIGRDATIRSTEHFTKEEVVIEIDRNGNVVSGAEDIYVSMLTVEDEDKFLDDVQTTFCHFIFFFNNKANGDTWVAGHENTFLITLQEAIELSQTKNRLQYRDFMK